MFDYLKKPVSQEAGAAPTMDLKTNPVWNYIKSGLADFVIEYVKTHKDEVIAIIVDVLTKLFASHPDVKKQVFAGLGEPEAK